MLKPKFSKKQLIAIFLLTVCHSPLHAASNAWSEVASIPEGIDGFFYTGEAFVGYRLAPTLKIFSSTNGSSWESHDSAISPIYVGHDGHGTLLAMTASGVASSNVSVELWKTATDLSWTNVGKIISGIHEQPANPSITACEDILLIQMTVGELILPPFVWKPYTMYEFTTSRLSPGIFQGGGYPIFPGAVSRPIVQGAQFVTMSHDSSLCNRIISSTNGRDWTVLFSSEGRRTLGSYDSFIFLYSLFWGASVLNEAGNAVPFNYPASGTPDTFIYNGSISLVTLGGSLYTSFDYAQTWATTQLTSIRGVGDNGHECLLADSPNSTNTTFYKLTYDPPVTCTTNRPIKIWFDSYEYEDSSLSFPPVTVTNTVNVLCLDSENTSSGVFQVECSRDLKEWAKLGLPRTNALTIDFTEFNSEPKMFFRLKAAQ
ncbi:MAG: hypothetical protein HOO88_03820 [Kiritimatiellaceae bacterium]|nr:hypothetical protein [Kiritimatiellaceae bacterium]